MPSTSPIASIISCILLCCFLRPVIDFFLDRKRLRRFHPLTPLCAVTDLAYMLHNARLDKSTTRTEALYKAHKNHAIIRLGPNRLSFASVDAIKDVYGTSTPCIKGDAPYVTPGGMPNILTVVDKGWHAVKRKRLSAAFATSHLLDWEAKIADKVERLLAQINKRVVTHDELLRWSPDDDTSTMEFRFWSHLFTFEAIGDIALSHHFGFLESGSDDVPSVSATGKTGRGSARKCLYAVNRVLEPIIWSSASYPVLKAFTQWLPAYGENWKRARQWPEIVRYIVDCRMERESEGVISDDLFACLLRDSKGQPLDLGEKEILAETSHLLDAGSDTTSCALTYLMYCLARHPPVLAKLRNEIDGAVDTDTAVPSYAQVRSLPYLRACIDEAMRLRPALSAGLQRQTPPEGMSIAGTWVPGNTYISVAAYIAHRDPKVSPDPDVFRPERWLGEEGNVLQKYSLTFSAGGRVCIGKNITYIEQTMLIAAIVKRYDFATPTQDWELQWEEHFNMWPRQLPLRFAYKR